ncbi:MAG: hypothetical protein H0X01_04655 [Nitrospira sp.]|nr:hypothetical protein [Nitrospira sp.]
MRMLQKSSSFVLASRKPSTYTQRTPRPSARCGLAGRTFSPFSIVLFVILGLVAVTAAKEDEHATVDPALARRAGRLIVARCALCHTTDLISQQRLPEDRWRATVEKMMRWGAILSKDEAAGLVQYLAARNHPDASDQLPSIEQESARAEPFQ